MSARNAASLNTFNKLRYTRLLTGTLCTHTGIQMHAHIYSYTHTQTRIHMHISTQTGRIAGEHATHRHPIHKRSIQFSRFISFARAQTGRSHTVASTFTSVYSRPAAVCRTLNDKLWTEFVVYLHHQHTLASIPRALPCSMFSFPQKFSFGFSACR